MWFITSVWSSVCGWYAVLIHRRVPLSRNSSCQKELTIIGSRSKTMLRGKPWCLQTKSRNRDVTLKVEKLVDNAPKCTPSEYRSTTTRITVNPCDGNRRVMKSIDRSSHTPSGIGKSCRSPASRLVLALVCWQTLHSLTKLLTSWRSPDQKKPDSRR